MRTPENGFHDTQECVHDQAANILKARYHPPPPTHTHTHSARHHAHDNGDGRSGRCDFVPRHQRPGDDRGLSTTPARAGSHDTIAKKDAQIWDLQVRVVSLEERCDELEQYSRRNTVRIRGLANEGTDGLVKDLAARKLEVEIGNSYVVRSHRVGKRPVDRLKPRDIIVRFTTHNLKTSVMRNARKLKQTNLFINEIMTKSRATIAWEARTLKRERKILDTWGQDINVFRACLGAQLTICSQK